MCISITRESKKRLIIIDGNDTKFVLESSVFFTIVTNLTTNLQPI